VLLGREQLSRERLAWDFGSSPNSCSLSLRDCRARSVLRSCGPHRAL
jgi:hypothetical protein